MSSADARPIALLDPGVVAGIAAGEVVERPASAVKELIENSLDAGATRVRVEYSDKGATRIVVADDGSGIADDQIELALARHATSKIRGLDELDSVATFGFRGEALAAIASASDLEIVTATETSDAGTRVSVRAGRIVGRAPAPARRGTRIEVRDLFAAVPARRKFLRSASAEAAMVADVVRRFALARPDVDFLLSSGERTLVATPAVAEPRDRIRQILGKEVSESLVEIDAELRGYRLRGHASAPGVAFGSSRRMSLFVGRRWVRDRLLFQAVLEGYETHLLRGRYPAVALFLEASAGVDVNVHPSKLEVRFADPDGVRRFVAEAVRDALRQAASPLGRWGLDAREALRREAAMPARREVRRNPVEPALTRTQTPADGFAASVRREPGAVARETESPPPPGYLPFSAGEAASRVEEQTDLDLGDGQRRQRLGRLEVIGQVLDGYFVCQGDGAVVLVDQHAGHERVLFERLMQAYHERGVARQTLLIPERVRVGAAQMEAIVAAKEILDGLGWEIDAFGDEEVVVRAMPAIAVKVSIAPLVEAIAADLVATGRARAAERAVERLLATVACHSAVRVGQRLDLVAARGLLAEMASVDYHATCPHGRPVARMLSRGQVERMFGR